MIDDPEDQEPVRLSLEMLPAQNGDCVLLRYQTRNGTTNILVDGGPRQTFENSLKTRLLSLAESGEILDLLVVTHVDCDHIDGIIEFLLENGESANPSIIRVGEVWHNSYRHLPTQASRSPTHHELDCVRAQVRRTSNLPPEHNIGAREGCVLAAVLERNGYNWNSSFQGNAVRSPALVKIGEVEVRVLSPGQTELDGLLSPLLPF